VRVTVVFDGALPGGAARDLGDAVWLVDSASNRKLFAELKSRAGFHSNSAIFTDQGAPSGEQVLDLIATVTDHHPDWTEIDVLAAPLTDYLAGEFERDAYVVQKSGNGFSLKRFGATRG
jgi:hypothetical protein